MLEVIPNRYRGQLLGGDFTPRKVGFGGGGCGQLPKTLSLFMTKIVDFPYPIYGPERKLCNAIVDGLIDNDEKVACSKKHTQD